MAAPAAWSRAGAGGPGPQDTGSGFPGRRSGAGLERADAGNGHRHLQPGHGSPEGCGSRFEDAGGVPAAQVTGRAQRVISTMARTGANAPSMYSVTPGSQTLISLNMEQSLSESA